MMMDADRIVFDLPEQGIEIHLRRNGTVILSTPDESGHSNQETDISETRLAAVLRRAAEGWRSVDQGPPYDGLQVAIRFADSKSNISYGVGWYSAANKKWVITAEPGGYEGTIVPVEWALLP